MMAIRAWFIGWWRVCRSPWMPITAYVVTLVLAVPLGVGLHRDLPSPAVPVAVEPGAGPAPNLDWLEEVTAGRGGLTGSMAPTMIGVAAPLANLDQLLDGRRPPLFVAALTLISMMAWSWLWGGIVARFANAPRGFIAACRRTFVPILTLSLVAVGLVAILFLTLRPLLFDVALPALTKNAAESTVFAWRLAFAIILVAVVAVTTVTADYARVALVVGDADSILDAMTRAARLIRTDALAVALVLMLSTGFLVALLIVYGAFEFIPGGSVPTLTRVIVIGQAFIFGRILLRLANAAAQTRLYQSLTRRATNR